MDAVSYTHLDVYKRQEEEQETLRSRIMGAGNFMGRNPNNNNITIYVTKLYNEAKYLECPCTEFISVSYTHLDVYKRQPLV